MPQEKIHKTSDLINHLHAMLTDIGCPADCEQYLLEISHHELSHADQTDLTNQKKLLETNFLTLLVHLMPITINILKSQRSFQYLETSTKLQFLRSREIFADLTLAEIKASLEELSPLWPFCPEK
jgi:hypothetical protein